MLMDLFHFWCRRHKPGRCSGANFLTDPHNDPASSGHEVLPAVPYGDPPSSAQHEPLPQLQYGESWCIHLRISFF